MKNRDLNKEFYLRITNYNINIEKFLIELYYREVIDFLVEFSLTKDSNYYNSNLEIVDVEDFINSIDGNELYKSNLLKLII